MKNTRKLRKRNNQKFSKRNRKAGAFFPKGYNLIKGTRNVFTHKDLSRQPIIGQHIGETGREIEEIIKPLKDVEKKMDDIMSNIVDIKVNCLTDCIKNAGQIDSETAEQITDMTKNKNIYEWGTMCSTSLRTEKCKELLKKIKEMEVYVKYIEALSEKNAMYSSKLDEIKENIDVSSELEINESF